MKTHGIYFSFHIFVFAFSVVEQVSIIYLLLIISPVVVVVVIVVRTCVYFVIYLWHEISCDYFID